MNKIIAFTLFVIATSACAGIADGPTYSDPSQIPYGFQHFPRPKYEYKKPDPVEPKLKESDSIEVVSLKIAAAYVLGNDHYYDWAEKYVPGITERHVQSLLGLEKSNDELHAGTYWHCAREVLKRLRKSDY